MNKSSSKATQFLIIKTQGLPLSSQDKFESDIDIKSVNKPKTTGGVNFTYSRRSYSDDNVLKAWQEICQALIPLRSV